MINIVDDIKKAKYITHSGTMHADEVFATAFLEMYKKEIQLYRTSEVNINEYPNALIYDIGRGEFDHHQQGSKLRDNGIPYCSLGLIWQRFGKDFLKQQGIKYVDEVFLEIDKDLIEGIDAIDNGIFPKVEAKYKIRNLCDVIKLFNPSFMSDEEENEQFLKAVYVAKLIFQEEILSCYGRVKARKLLETKIPEAIKKHYLILNKFMPYEETIYNLDKNKEIYFVIFPSNRGGWAAKTINKSADDHNSRVPYPKEWAGLEKDLANVSGVEKATFCHLGRFIACAETKEAIIKLVEIAISKSDK